MIIENGFMKNENGKGFTFGLPNKSRYLKKLEEERLKGNNFNLSDVVKDHQMEYSCSDKENNYYNSITVEELNKGITKVLNSFKISEEDYQNYVDFLNNEIDKIRNINNNEIAKINLAVNRLRGEKKELMRVNLTKKRDKEEEKVYQDEIKRLNREIEIQKDSINDLDAGEEHKMLEFELFLKVLSNAKNYYKKANIVLKRKMLKILFSNITFTSKKELMFHINSPFEKNFTSFGGVIQCGSN